MSKIVVIHVRQLQISRLNLGIQKLGYIILTLHPARIMRTALSVTAVFALFLHTTTTTDEYCMVYSHVVFCPHAAGNKTIWDGIDVGVLVPILSADSITMSSPGSNMDCHNA